MASSVPHTGFARLTPVQARAVLAAVAVLAGLAVAITLSPLAEGKVNRPARGDDVALYAAEIQRIHAGEGYYTAAAAELTARGYPTRSVFNWRTPLPMWLVGQLPPGGGKLLLGGLALALVFLAFSATAEDAEEQKAEGRGQKAEGRRARGEGRGAPPQFAIYNLQFSIFNSSPLLAVLLLSGPLLFCVVGDLFVMPVLWAGVLIALSVAAYGVNRPALGVAFGLAAVFCRELALPYCVLAMMLAQWHGRRREFCCWAVGLAAWLCFFAWHGMQVSALIAPDARAHPHGWLRCGGAAFVIATVQMNAYLLLLPQWVAALYLVAALVGLAGWHTPLGLRAGLTLCLFLAAFATVGQEFNQYWGSLMAPLLCLGVARCPASLADLWKAATKPSRNVGGSPTGPSIAAV